MSLLPMAESTERADHGPMVPIQMMKQLADQRTAALRELGSRRGPGIDWRCLFATWRRRLHRRESVRPMPEPTCPTVAV